MWSINVACVCLSVDKYIKGFSYLRCFCTNIKYNIQYCNKGFRIGVVQVAMLAKP